LRFFGGAVFTGDRMQINAQAFVQALRRLAWELPVQSGRRSATEELSPVAVSVR
jgi:hypothetical protein